MSITVTCTKCGTELDANVSGRCGAAGRSSVPQCGCEPCETGYVEVIGDDADVREPGAAETGVGREHAA